MCEWKASRSLAKSLMVVLTRSAGNLQQVLMVVPSEEEVTVALNGAGECIVEYLCLGVGILAEDVAYKP